jgi:hypothetical protein
MKTQQQRTQERRQAKLELIQEQIDAGKLVVRKMTPEERAKFPARPATTKRRTRSRA